MTIRSLLGTLLLAATAHADFPELFNSEPTDESGRMPAVEAASKMQLPSGFRATVFASEPDVQNPIDYAWDSRGRLWIAENYTYAERGQKFQLDLRDRVVIFDGTTGDRFKSRSVFTDDVQMLTSVEVGHDGVWLMCPPKLIFIPDRNHDDVPDTDGEVVLDGFTVDDANYHNFANGLRFGPDGWLYGRCGASCPGRIGVPGTPDHQRLALDGGIWRYHPVRKQVEVLTTGTMNPWGHDWNEVGELFHTNTVTGHLWHMIPGAHFKRSFTLDPNPRTYELIGFHADHYHFDSDGHWTESRDGVANDYGGGHSHAGTMIYQDSNWPEKYRGKLFTLNLHGRRANQERLVREGGGYVAKHDDDFFVAADTWFRGMDMTAGPDGGVFVLDWSDTGECHEHSGVHRTSGRIYKITHGQAKSNIDSFDDIMSWPTESLGKKISSPDAWWRRQCRLELARRAETGTNVSPAIDVLRQSYAAGIDSRAMVQSLLTLHIIGGTDTNFLSDQLDHADQYVRAWAIRLLSENWTIDDAIGPAWIDEELAVGRRADIERSLTDFERLATDDPSALVRLTLASTLQRLPIDLRPRLAKPLVAHVEDSGDHNLPLLLWYGLIAVGEDQIHDLADVAAVARIPTTLRLLARRLAEDVDRNPAAIGRLLARAAASDDRQFQSSVVDGVAEGLTGWRQANKPPGWDALAALALDDRAAAKVREISVVFGDGRSLDELKAIVTGAVEAPYPIRVSALEQLIQIEPDDLRSICESVLRDGRLNVTAAHGLSKYDDPSIGKSLVSRYGNFRGPFRPQVISILVSRKSYARELLSAIGDGRIPRNALSAFQVRQIHSLDDEELRQTVAEVWGEVRESNEQKQATIESLKQRLTTESLAQSDKRNGRELFKKHCQNCHRLYGEGAGIGPDLTGSNRSDLDYLLGNIIDPSSIVDKDYRMTILLLDDGRVINGLVTAETPQTVSVQTATEALVFDRRDIESQKITQDSPMPDGLFDTLSDKAISDMIGYLQHPSQVE